MHQEIQDKESERQREREEIKSASGGVTGVAVVEGLERKEKTTMRRDSASGKHEASERLEGEPLR